MTLLRAFANWWARSLVTRVLAIVLFPFIVIAVVPVELLATFLGGKVSTAIGLSQDAALIATFLFFFILVAMILEIIERIRIRHWQARLDRYLQGRKNSN